MFSSAQISDLLYHTWKRPEDFTGGTSQLWVSRAGCSYCDNQFFITRQQEYPYYTIHYLFDGCGFFHIQGKDYLLKKGDLFLIPPNQAHTYRNSSSEPLGLLWTELSGSVCREIFSPLILNRQYVLTGLDGEPLAEAMVRLLRALETLPPDSSGRVPGPSTRESGDDRKVSASGIQPSPDPYRISGLAYQILMELLRLSHTAPSPHPVPYIQEALDDIHQNFTRPLKIEALAERCHISPAHLTRLFRQQVGMTPLKYLHMKRMEYARLLLTTTSMTGSQIADAIGMYDNSSFCRTFRSICGCTPEEYRRQNAPQSS